MEAGSSFGRPIVMWLTRPWTFVAFLVLLAGVFLYFGLEQSLRARKTKTLPFQAMTGSKYPGILFVFCPGTKDTALGLLTLLGFESPEALYDFVYKKFDEAAFEKILIHRVGSAEPAEFVRAPDRSDAENLQRLQALL
jgi:hypothetical protein